MTGAALAVAPGLALGSFLNVVVARVPLGISIVHPRSACGACGAEIAWYDNVPILSWVLLRGRCRACRSPISLVYPAVEAGTAALLTAVVVAFGFTAYAALAAFFCAVLVALAAIDLRHFVVPNVIVLPAAGVVLFSHLAIDPSLEWPLAAVGACSAFLAIALVAPRGLGLGDVKLMLLLGAMLGVDVVVAVMVGLLAALVPAGIVIARHGRASRGRKLPLAPFLALGALAALFGGDALLEAYTGLWAG
jgi:leader peptidase (prepilin peptidase) / N-methyltransferase